MALTMRALYVSMQTKILSSLPGALVQLDLRCLLQVHRMYMYRLKPEFNNLRGVTLLTMAWPFLEDRNVLCAITTQLVGAQPCLSADPLCCVEDPDSLFVKYIQTVTYSVCWSLQLVYLID